MPLVRRLALALALALVPAALAVPLAAQQDLHDAAEIESRRDQVLSNEAYQTEKPAPEEQPQTEPFQIPPWLVEALLWFFGLLVIGIVLYFLFNLLMDLWGGRSAFRRKRDAPSAGEAVVETPVILDLETRQRTLAEADALAAEGRFTEAIHLLLLVAMERLRRELGPRVAPALTSREVLGRVPIPEAVVDPLTRMVALSEIKHFGGRSAGEPDYQSCRRDFLHFSTGEPVAA